MIFYKKYKERIQLLEFENKILFERLAYIEKEFEVKLPPKRPEERYFL